MTENDMIVGTGHYDGNHIIGVYELPFGIFQNMAYCCPGLYCIIRIVKGKTMKTVIVQEKGELIYEVHMD